MGQLKNAKRRAVCIRLKEEGKKTNGGRKETKKIDDPKLFQDNSKDDLFTPSTSPNDDLNSS